MKVSWKKGAYELHIEHHDKELISVKLDYNILGYWMGKIKLEMRIINQEFKDLRIETDYSLDGASKSLELRLDYGTLFLTWILIGI